MKLKFCLHGFHLRYLRKRALHETNNSHCWVSNIQDLKDNNEYPEHLLVFMDVAARDLDKWLIYKLKRIG